MSVKAREEVRNLPENEEHPVLILELDNGDRKIFESVKNDWNFKDEESLVRFAIAILSKSSDKNGRRTRRNSSKHHFPNKTGKCRNR